jgi:hypothetical protein
MNKIILLSSICLLNSCAEVSHKLKAYKWVPGSYETNGDERKKTNLIYYGKKNESLADAAYKWHQYAQEHCFNGEYYISSTSTPLTSDAESVYIEGVLVYFPEQNQWPQANATYVCNRPL